METMLLQRERTRASQKRGPMKHAATEEDEDEENEEESIAVIMGNEATETTKMESLDLIKAFDESFSAIHSALRPSLEILPAELSDTVAAVNKDIFASKSEGSARAKKLDPKAILEEKASRRCCRRRSRWLRCAARRMRSMRRRKRSRRRRWFGRWLRRLSRRRLPSPRRICWEDSEMRLRSLLNLKRMRLRKRNRRRRLSRRS